METDLADRGSAEGGERRGRGTPGSSPKHMVVAVAMGAPGTVKGNRVPFRMAVMGGARSRSLSECGLWDEGSGDPMRACERHMEAGLEGVHRTPLESRE